MPTYQYECTKCSYRFEELQGINASPLVKCPKCSEDTLIRIITGGTGFLLKGDGWPGKASRVESSDVYRTQKEAYEGSYGGADVTHARRQIETAGRKRRKQSNNK